MLVYRSYTGIKESHKSHAHNNPLGTHLNFGANIYAVFKIYGDHTDIA